MAYETLGSPLKLDAIKNHPCYFGRISRELAEKYLKNRATTEGTFLVREGNDGFRLSVLIFSEGECSVLHYKIDRLSNKTYFIDSRYSFATVVALVDFYKRKHTNMPQPLTDPCPKTDIAPTEGNPERYYCNADTSDFTSVVKESITLKTQIASGKFGEVWKGYLNTSNEEIVVKVQSEEMNSRKYLLEEARAISDVSHKHVISLLGVIWSSGLVTLLFFTIFMVYLATLLVQSTKTTDGACMVVLEFCYNKDLLDYLLRNDVYEISNAERLRFVQEIASALQHISNSGYVHRNVKASNVLLTSNSTCKLSGFGFAKKLGSNGVYVGTNIDKPFGPKAIRWMALEAAEYEQFSASSDVWALGCLFHEIFTDGEAPFSGILTPNILSKLKAGYRSPKPPTIPVEIYNLMLECWNPHPMERPPLDLIQVLINEKRTQKEISYLVPNEPAPVPKIESPTKKTSSTKKIDRKMTYIKMKSILVKK